MDGNLVFPVPPDDIIKKQAQPTLELLWVSGLSRWNGRRMTGGSAETHLIVVYIFYSPLKNMLDANLVFPGPPDDIIKKRAHPTLELLWGRGLSRCNGRRRTMAAGERVVDGAHGFRVVKISSGLWFQMCTFFGDVGVKILMHYST